MNVKYIVIISNIKKKIINLLRFCLTPLAKVVRKHEQSKYQKRMDYLANLPLEKVAKMYVKYTVKYMARCKHHTYKLYHCEIKGRYCDDSSFILGDLSTFGYSRFSKTKLKSWSYNSQYYPKGFGEETDKKWIELENKLQELAEKEFIRVGCKVEHMDESEDLDELWIQESDYKYTMIISL